MGRRIAVGLVWAVGACVVGAFAGGWLIATFSSNVHDRDVEAAMTGAFVIGPIAGIVGFVIGVVRAGRRAA
jgi:hypothetical protein